MACRAFERRQLIRWALILILVAVAFAFIAASPAVAQAPLSIVNQSRLGFGVVGWPYSQYLDASGGSPSYSWSLVAGALPPGIELFARQILRGTPTTSGTFTFWLRVTDGAGASLNGEFTIDITALGPDRPFIATSKLTDGIAGEPYTENLDAFVGALPPTWSVARGSLPPGLSLSGARISGTPTAPGYSSFVLRVTDGKGTFSERSFSISVMASSGALRIRSASRLRVLQKGLSFDVQLAAAGAAPPYAWSVASGWLPPGLTVGSDGRITGTANELGTYHFSIWCIDSRRAAVRKEQTIVIIPRGGCPASYYEGMQGLPFATRTLSFSGMVPPVRLCCESSGGDCPDNAPAPGMRLDPDTGVLSGTPTVSGLFLFGIRLEDNSFHWNDVLLANWCFNNVFTVYPRVSSALLVTSDNIANGTVGVAYNEVFAVAGGSAPYTWQVSSGALPPGLALNPSTGAISGTPSNAGTWAFVLRVTDRDGMAAERAYVLRVNASAVPVIRIVGPQSETVNPEEQVKLDVTLASPHSSEISGTLSLSFLPDAVNNADESAVRLSTGGRSVGFTIPAGSKQASFAGREVLLQTGTVAGVISMRVSAQETGGSTLTYEPRPIRTVRVLRYSPRIRSVTIRNRSASGFEVEVVGYSTTRELGQATFTFTASSGYTIQSTTHSVSLTAASAGRYSAALPGGTFAYTQPFAVQGDLGGIGSVSVTLTNSVGTSQPTTANF